MSGTNTRHRGDQGPLGLRGPGEVGYKLLFGYFKIINQKSKGHPWKFQAPPTEEMDVDGLPLVGPGTDVTKVPGIQWTRPAAFLNQAVVSTAQSSILSHSP